MICSSARSPALAKVEGRALVRAAGFERVDEGAIPPALAHGLHSGFLGVSLPQSFLDEPRRRFGGECEQTVLIADHEIARAHRPSRRP